MPDYEVLLFDLMGVLVRIDAAITRRMLDLSGRDRFDFRHFWATSATTRSFDLGKITPDQFAHDVVSELGLSLPPSDFLRLYGQWIEGLDEGAAPMLAELKGRYRLACLTNINPVLWPIIRDRFGLGQLLDTAFLSFEIGMLKPDQQLYQYVINQLGCLPGKIAFFDDSEANVLPARAIGMEAYMTQGATDVRTILERHGIL